MGDKWKRSGKQVGDKRGTNGRQVYNQSTQTVVEGIQGRKPGGRSKITQNFMLPRTANFSKEEELHTGKLVWGRKWTKKQ